jgi:hypothetical protein
LVEDFSSILPPYSPSGPDVAVFRETVLALVGG